MKHTPNVLIVAPNPSLAATLRRRLAEAGLRATLVSSFSAARDRLAALPDLLISELRLGEYNGLHLALRARYFGVPAIVMGREDESVRREAEQLGASYVCEDCESEQLAKIIRAAGIMIPAARFRHRTQTA